MRVRGRLALFVLAVVSAALASAADEPAPLLKVVSPTGGNLRVRFAVTPGFPKPMTFAAQVPNGKKKSELLDVRVAYDSLPNPSYITAKKLESLGYDAGKAKEFLLPELLIPAVQIAPKAAKGGADVVIRITNLKLTVINDPASTDQTIHTGDLCISATGMFQNAERTMEPRLSFADKFLEMTVPAAAVKRPGTDAGTAPEVTVNPDTKLVPAVGLTTPRGNMPAFVWASIDGQDSYKLPDGKTTVPVNVAVSSISNMPDGIMVTLGLARGVKLEMDLAGAAKAATGVESKSEFVTGKIKELRIELFTGPGLKTKKDLVLKDLPVYVDRNVSDGYMFIGQKFMDKYVADAVYTHPGDGWKLHGRINPDLLFDIKTRKKP